ILYGLSAATAFAFYIGIEIVKIMIEVTNKIPTNTGGPTGQLLHTGVYNIPQVSTIIMSLIIINAVVGSLIIKIIDGGHKINALPHFVGLTWAGSIVATLTPIFVSSFISV
ncbi:MAG: flagellar assembly protein FlaJ, partial [Halobacteria archaeon]|nr:flagellar assembly protein FlaJ [Halobacteria archaeon]